MTIENKETETNDVVTAETAIAEPVVDTSETTSEDNISDDAGTSSIPETGASAVNYGGDPAKPLEKSSGYQKRIDKLTGRNHQLARELEAAREQVAFYQGPEDNEDDFGYNDLNDNQEQQAYATAADVQAAVQASLTAHEQRRANNNATAIQQQQVANEIEIFRARLDQFKASNPDADKVWQVDMGKDSSSLISHIRKSENGPAMAYEIANNPELHQFLQTAPINDALIELGRLDASLKAAQQPAKEPEVVSRLISNAPAPIDTLTGSATSASEVDLDDLSHEEYIKARGLD